jgi:hypothetical protein
MDGRRFLLGVAGGGGWRLIHGLNLATGTPEEAAAEAAYVAHAVGPQLLAFQIGNEANGFGRWSDVRSKSYSIAAFLDEWRRFAAAVVPSRRVGYAPRLSPRPCRSCARRGLPRAAAAPVCAPGQRLGG